MARLLPLLFALACGAVSAQDSAPLDTPLRDAHVVAVQRAADGGFEFEAEGQDHDFEVALNPDGVLVVAATDGLRVLVLTESASYIDNDYPNNRPLLVGPEMLQIDGRDRDEVGVLRVVPELPRSVSAWFVTSLLVCTAETPYGECLEWTAARPSRRVFAPDGAPSGLQAGLHVRVVARPIVLSPAPAPPDPPDRPIRD